MRTSIGLCVLFLAFLSVCNASTIQDGPKPLKDKKTITQVICGCSPDKLPKCNKSLEATNTNDINLTKIIQAVKNLNQVLDENTMKKLIVKRSAQALREQDDCLTKKTKIECDNGLRINILSAQMTNLNKLYCPAAAANMHMQTMNCTETDKTTEITAKLCNGEKSCLLSVDMDFDGICDCHDQKYLQVEFSCTADVLKRSKRASHYRMSPQLRKRDEFFRMNPFFGEYPLFGDYFLQGGFGRGGLGFGRKGGNKDNGEDGGNGVGVGNGRRGYGNDNVGNRNGGYGNGNVGSGNGGYGGNGGSGSVESSGMGGKGGRAGKGGKGGKGGRKNGGNGGNQDSSEESDNSVGGGNQGGYSGKGQVGSSGKYSGNGQVGSSGKYSGNGQVGSSGKYSGNGQVGNQGGYNGGNKDSYASVGSGAYGNGGRSRASPGAHLRTNEKTGSVDKGRYALEDYYGPGAWGLGGFAGLELGVNGLGLAYNPYWLDYYYDALFNGHGDYFGGEDMGYGGDSYGKDSYSRDVQTLSGKKNNVAANDQDEDSTDMSSGRRGHGRGNNDNNSNRSGGNNGSKRNNRNKGNNKKGKKNNRKNNRNNRFRGRGRGRGFGLGFGGFGGFGGIGLGGFDYGMYGGGLGGFY